jgi:hypothetical protein
MNNLYGIGKDASGKDTPFSVSIGPQEFSEFQLLDALKSTGDMTTLAKLLHVANPSEVLSGTPEDISQKVDKFIFLVKNSELKITKGEPRKINSYQELWNLILENYPSKVTQDEIKVVSDWFTLNKNPKAKITSAVAAVLPAARTTKSSTTTSSSGTAQPFRFVAPPELAGIAQPFRFMTPPESAAFPAAVASMAEPTTTTTLPSSPLQPPEFSVRPITPYTSTVARQVLPRAAEGQQSAPLPPPTVPFPQSAYQQRSPEFDLRVQTRKAMEMMT